MYGLSDKTIEAIKSVFQQFPEIQRVILYGSRAKGNYRTGSDIDLTMVGTQIEFATLLTIETLIDDLLLPYKIDLSIYHKIESRELLDHIDNKGITFYVSASPARQ